MKRAILILLFTVVVQFTFLTWAEDSGTVSSPIKHVVLIGMDGYGSAYVNWDEVPNLKKMKDNGAWTLKTRCVLPSVSAINWASILMGAGSELHGYRTWGSSKPDLPSRVLTEKGKFPCIFHVVRDQMPEALTASTYTWKTIGDLHESSDVSLTKFIEKNNYAEMTRQFIEWQKQSPVLSFIYYSEPDEIGHSIGWGTPEYQKTVTQIDSYIGQILKFLEDNDRLKDTLVILVSDHGGTEKGHGKDILVHMETPFLMFGANVKTGEIEDVVVNYDTAATIIWALGLKAPQVWRGKPVESAFAK